MVFFVLIKLKEELRVYLTRRFFQGLLSVASCHSHSFFLLSPSQNIWYFHVPLAQISWLTIHHQGALASTTGTTTPRIKTSLVLAYFSNIVECERSGIIAKKSQRRKCLFSSDVFLVVAAVIAKAAHYFFSYCLENFPVFIFNLESLK